MSLHEAVSRILTGWTERRLSRHPQDMRSAQDAAQAAVDYYYAHLDR